MQFLRFHFLIPAVLAALLASGLRADIPDQSALEPTPKQQLATELITGFIVHYHYKRPALNDALSADILSSYIENLDPNRSYFLKSDIEAFSKYETRLDDYLREANLEPAFEIFRVFQQRLYEQVDYALGLIDNHFDFTVDESYVFDRSEEPWAASRRQLDEIWRKSVKNDALSLRLAGQGEDEITEILRGRYERLGARAGQFRADDVYELFINAFTQSVEPHTAYLLPRVSEDFEIRMSLSLEGIGAVLQSEHEYTVVREIVAGGPADNSNQLHVEDRITGVGQGEEGKIVDVVGWRLDEVVDLIRGPKGSVVRLQVLSKGSGVKEPPKIITITRNEVKLEDQAARKSIIKIPTDEGPAHIGIIKVPAFYMDYEAFARGDPNYRSTTRDVRRLLDELKQADVEGIVVDLRGNGGGSLTEATQLTGLFIESGPIVQVKDITDRIEVLQDPDPGIAYAGPLAVLVDSYSASASEIFAGAIQDYARGIVIGEPTFGKGTVQKMVDLNQIIGDAQGGLGQLKTTIAQFYRVSGASTQHRGVMPDIIFPTASDSGDQGERALDNALPWDNIHAVNFAPREIRSDAINRARRRHMHRVQHNPAFEYLLGEIRANQKTQRNDEISLLIKQRRKEMEAMVQASLNRENRFRKARGLPARAEGDIHTNAEALDPDRMLLREAAHILHDLIQSPFRAPDKLQAADYGR
jgi:carboxyl-terminal processing protease